MSDRDKHDISQNERTPDELVRHHLLISWLRDHGGHFHSDVHVAFDPARGFHALVASGKTLAAQTRIASCPMDATLSVLNPLDVEPFACRGVRFPAKFLDRFCTSPDILQSFFLMEHYLLGDKSWWGHYIATLPTQADIKLMQFDLPADRTWVVGTNLEGAVDIQLGKWWQSYNIGLEQLKIDNWQSAVNGLLSWDLYRWAATIFGTRSFTSQVLADTKPADLARPLGRDSPHHSMLSRLFSDRFAVLLPVLDILNHKPAAKIEWQAQYDSVGLEILEDYQEGQELFNNYGPRDNESLLLSYGFVLEDNPFDHVIVSIRVPPGSSLADARTWPADSRSNDHFNCYIFGLAHPIVHDGRHVERAFFSYDLLDSISVLVGNDRELQSMYSQRKTLMSSYLPSSFPDFRNLLATLSQLMQDCRARVIRLQLTDPMQSETSIQPLSQSQKNAHVYRQSQMTILQNAIAVCAFVVFHAATDLDDEIILTTMQAELPTFYSGTLKDVLRKLPCLTARHELLTVDAILQTLPTAFKKSLQEDIKNITRALEEAKELPTHHSDVIKSGFAVALAAICYEFMSETQLGTQLEPRLKNWFENLTQWYPPNDENWAYVPGPGPWTPEEEPPPALVILLSTISRVSTAQYSPWHDPELICWGWNVMEEEGVRVPVEIERFCNGIVEASVEEGAIGFLMYCKQ